MAEKPRNPLEHFPPDASSVRQARLHVQKLAGVDVGHAAALCVSELATNAVLHARTEFSVNVTVRGSVIRVEVDDHAPGLPTSSSHGLLTIDGRGLQIVEGLSDNWGVEPRNDGKCVWFEMPAER